MQTEEAFLGAVQDLADSVLPASAAPGDWSACIRNAAGQICKTLRFGDVDQVLAFERGMVQFGFRMLILDDQSDCDFIFSPVP